jgi:lysozyme
VNISEKGIAFVKSFEKFRPTPYDDGYGYETVGYGHRILRGEIWPPDGIDTARADTVLVHDLQDPMRTVNVLVRTATQQQFDALVSFVFNVGTGNFRGSTLLKLLVKGDITGAADEFLKWDKSSGQVSAGLKERRAKERLIFVQGEYLNHA